MLISGTFWPVTIYLVFNGHFPEMMNSVYLSRESPPRHDLYQSEAWKMPIQTITQIHGRTKQKLPSYIHQEAKIPQHMADERRGIAVYHLQITRGGGGDVHADQGPVLVAGGGGVQDFNHGQKGEILLNFHLDKVELQEQITQTPGSEYIPYHNNKFKNIKFIFQEAKYSLDTV